MFPRRRRITAGTSALLLVLGTLTLATAGPAGAARASNELCGPGSAITFDPTAYQAAPRITNPWMPLTPGMQFTTTGTVTETSTGTVHGHSVVHTVTGLTKVIAGITTRVLWDRDYQDGELQESELAFFAQTRDGTVWLFGEYPEEYEAGQFVGAPSTFIHGLAKAQAGIAMPARPSLTAPDYVQAYAPKVDFLDCGNVILKDQHVRVPTGFYNDVLVIDEYNPLEPPDAGHQQKFYSEGTGLVRVTAVGGTEQEFMDLVQIATLNAAQLSEVNAQALEQDARGYKVSRSVYAKTAPAQIEQPGS